MKEFELKYGCNPNQKPAKIDMADGSDLPITIKLNGIVIPVLQCIAVTGLHRTANSEIDRKIQYVQAFFLADRKRIVLRAVIDDHIVKLRCILNDIPHSVLYALFLIVSRNNN